MALITLPFTFSAGAVIIAAQHNSNFSTIYSDYNGNITNANIANSAGILASKLDLSSPPAIGGGSPAAGTFTTLSTTGLASLTSLLVGSVHQGDVLYDNGTSIVRLTPGISGQFLQTKGAAANPQWTTSVTPSNVVFSWVGTDDFGDGTNSGGYGLYSGSSVTPNAGTLGKLFFVTGTSISSNQIVLRSKFSKILGISTFTVYARGWCSTDSNGVVRIDVGSVNGTSATLSPAVTPTWQPSFTIDVSSLLNGTVYDLTVGLSNPGGFNTYLSSIIIFGS